MFSIGTEVKHIVDALRPSGENGAMRPCTLVLLSLSLLAATPARAAPVPARGGVLPAPAPPQEAPRNHLVSVQLGGQIEIMDYRSGFKLEASYAYRIRDPLWLDFATGVVIHRNTNLGLDAGIRWRFGRATGVVPFVRTSLEVAFLFDVDTSYVIGFRGGGGAGYFWSPGFGLTLEGSLVFGPIFGGASGVAGAADVFVGAEFPF